MRHINTMDYKLTLNLPETAFPMKGNLPQTEPERIKKWDQLKIYQKLQDRKRPKGRFVFPDGPPYANGNIHLGHTLNKVLKDIVTKYKNMSGYQCAFIPGWDCHGLPIELKVTKRLGDKRKDMTDAQVREQCREEALTWIETQKGQFQRLGVMADWEHPYYTLQSEYEAEEIRVLARIHDKGVLYQGEKPVYWSPSLQTAFAAAEVEYKDHKSLSIFVKFYLDNKEAAKLTSDKKPVAFVIWTTTPWTLPANYGIAANAAFEYGLYDSGSELLILAKDLKEAVEKETGLQLSEVKTFKGETFDRMKAKHPFMDRESLVVLGDHVTLDTGSGLVHTAPGHGMDDYHVGMKYGLPVHSPVNEAGKFTDEVPEFQGMKIWDANPKIVEKLKQSGHLLAVKDLIHSYPHDNRIKAPLIFRSTPQWFVRMDDEKFPIRKMALDAIENEIDFVPDWGMARLQAMVSNTPDWCLSRQRIWGVPIPVFYCEKCKTPLVSSKVMNKVADVMESSKKGIEAYHSEPISTFTQGEKCSKCSSTEFTKGRDILDVWFDSGVCHTAVQKKRPELDFPADIYLEGSDQHRGWFQTSLISSIAAYGKPPYKALITHGFVNDAQGLKMSKSQGNVIDPLEVIKKSGAEILRLWVAYEDYGQDVTIGNELFDRVTETYRRFRNTFRFMLGNLGDFNPAKDQVPFEKMTALDQWALIRLNALIEKNTESFENYDFYKVYHATNNFFTVELSATYLDILKDRLYTWKKEGLPRRSAQTVIYQLLKNLSVMMAPILTFLSEEVYENLPGDRKESVLLEEFPTVQSAWKKDGLQEQFEHLLHIRSEIQKRLEELRKNKVIGSGLEAKITIKTYGPHKHSLEHHKDLLREFFIVSQVTVLESPNVEYLAEKADGTKCVRCWTYSSDTGKDSRFPDVCPKCVEALA